MPKVVLGLAAASVAFVVVGKLVQQGGSSASTAGGPTFASGAGGSPLSDAGRETASPTTLGPAGVEDRGVFSSYVATGRAFTEGTMARQARDLVTMNLRSSEATAPGRPFFSSAEQARNCLALIGAPDGATSRIEIGTYAGIPAALVAYADPATPRSWTAIVVGDQCGVTTSEPLAGPVHVTATAR